MKIKWSIIYSRTRTINSLLSFQHRPCEVITASRNSFHGKNLYRHIDGGRVIRPRHQIILRVDPVGPLRILFLRRVGPLRVINVADEVLCRYLESTGRVLTRMNPTEPASREMGAMPQEPVHRGAAVIREIRAQSLLIAQRKRHLEFLRRHVRVLGLARQRGLYD